MNSAITSLNGLNVFNQALKAVVWLQALTMNSAITSLNGLKVFNQALKAVVAAGLDPQGSSMRRTVLFPLYQPSPPPLATSVFHPGFCCVRVRGIGLRLLYGARFSQDFATQHCRQGAGSPLTMNSCTPR
jgi:hypothetical protein